MPLTLVLEKGRVVTIAPWGGDELLARLALPAETLFAHETQTRLGKMQDAEAEFQNHPVVTALLQEGGQIVPDSIKPLELK